MEIICQKIESNDLVVETVVVMAWILLISQMDRWSMLYYNTQMGSHTLASATEEMICVNPKVDNQWKYSVSY